MKKLWLYLGTRPCWRVGAGEATTVLEPLQLSGSTTIRGQYYDSRHLSCDPRDPSCYRDYHAAPYADPFSQFLYYVAPPVDRDQRYDSSSVSAPETYSERKERNHQEIQDLKQEPASTNY